MTPFEKATDLLVTFMERFPDGEYSQEAAKSEAKFCAGIVIDEILSLKMIHVMGHDDQFNEYGYWEQVKQELKKL